MLDISLLGKEVCSYDEFFLLYFKEHYLSSSENILLDVATNVWVKQIIFEGSKMSHCFSILT